MLTEEKAQELRAKFPGRKFKKATVTLDDGRAVEFAIASPTRAEYQRMTDELLDPAKRSGAIERAVRAAIKYPDPKEVDALASEYPAIFNQLSETLSKLSGAQLKVEEADF